jgi:hypothetical protein
MQSRLDPSIEWLLDGIPRSDGRCWFEIEKVGAPSRQNTPRALRALKWWDQAA